MREVDDLVYGSHAMTRSRAEAGAHERVASRVPARLMQASDVIAEDRLLTIAEEISSVAGVRAVVLGGSRARGTHHAESDVDLGIYYDAVTLDLRGLTEMTGAFNATGQVVVAGPGEWGVDDA